MWVGLEKKPRVILACERSGHYMDSMAKKEGHAKKKIKQTGSKKCGCLISLKGKKLGTNDDWMLEVMCDVHNHPAAEYLEGHSFVGRLSEDKTKLLVDMSRSIVRPKEILIILKQRNNLNVKTMKTIYNARYKHKIA
eukprot:TRINITY_DN20136_c0_g2_i6.p1 TRINITY_DN20136_c0_g2~~TRINITY_DN20136_c0_g2_i6.p1  ORF type:complete len:137 (-),score=20.21 TRINITY_DN20136_c0_g2_i6:915-1325(-)